MKKIFYLTVAIALCSAARGELPEKSIQGRGATVLNEVWNTLCTKNFNKNFDRDYRRTIYVKYLPLVNACRDDAAVAKNINLMLREIGQSHLMVIPPENRAVQAALAAINTRRVILPGANVPAGIGLTLCRDGDALAVLRVCPGMPAAAAGIRPGWRILAINDYRFNLSVQSYFPWTLLAGAMLSGYPGTEVKITAADSRGAIKKLTLARKADGGKWFKLGAMPETRAVFEAEMLDGNIGWIYFTAFFPDQIKAIRDAVTGKLRHADALIIDLRDNIGGLMLLGQWAAGWLSPREIPLGTMVVNGALPLKLVSCPQKESFKGPLAVLIGKGTCSTAEVLAAALQDSGQAVLFGETTSGKCLPSQFLVLPSGFKLQTVCGDFIRANGLRIEGNGVNPDISVTVKTADLNNGRDTVREAAAAFLREKIQDRKTQSSSMQK